MTTMIEKVARAIFVELGWEGVGAHPSYDHDPKPWEDAARAAIEAMLEPTEEMIREAVGMSDFLLPDALAVAHENYDAEMRDAYQHMISAALKEQP